MTQSLAAQVEAIRPEPPLKQIQISRKVRTAVTLMVWEGSNRKEAAERAGITESALYKAMRQPKVKALYAAEMEEFRQSAPTKAFRDICTLADSAKSEEVRLRASMWVAGVGGVAPVKNVRVEAKVTHGFEDYDYAQDAKDVTPK